MNSRIFLSCGQRKDEIEVARQIERMLIDRNFKVYVAGNVQSIFEINSGIIGELKNSDCFVLVNFCRERLGWWERKFRGSLFSNQEFAIAYALRFERILVINQKGFKPEGMLCYFGCNTEEFENYRDCVVVVERALDQTGWQPDYSRRLRAGQVQVSRKIHYTNQETGIDLTGDMFLLDIHNKRPDIAALEATGRLVSYKPNLSTDEICPKFRSALKAAGKPGFSHTIFPRSHEAFDLLCIGESRHTPGAQHVYLNSALDLAPTPHLEITNGVSELKYEFCSIDFPVLTVVIELVWPQDEPPSAKLLTQEVS